RTPIAAAELTTIGYTALRSGADVLGQKAVSGLGDEVLAQGVVQSGVVRTVVSDKRVVGGAVVTTATENGAVVTPGAADAAGRPLWSTDEAGNVTTFQHDALGRLVGVTLADGRRHVLRFDGYGRPASVEREGVERISYLYDPATGMPAGKTIAAPDGHEDR